MGIFPYEDVPIEILDRQVKRLKDKEVPTVKMLWRNDLVEGLRWEVQVNMRFHFPHLFNSWVIYTLRKSGLCLRNSMFKSFNGFGVVSPSLYVL